MTNLFLYFVVVVFGLSLGSFANVMVLRDKERLSILTGRSHCMDCDYELQWYDLFPVLSYFFLKGKCRSCKKTISWQYPLVELLSGALAVLILWFSLANNVPYLAGIGFFLAFWWLLVVSVIDIRSLEVPVEYVVVAGILGGISAWYGLNATELHLLLGAVIGAGSLAAVLLIWKLITKQDGMGEGDLWIAGAIGAIVGYPAIFVALMVAVFSGAVIGSISVALQKKKFSTAVPFGPFLFLGALIALLWGQRLIDWYILAVWI